MRSNDTYDMMKINSSLRVNLPLFGVVPKRAKPYLLLVALELIGTERNNPTTTCKVLACRLLIDRWNAQRYKLLLAVKGHS